MYHCDKTIEMKKKSDRLRNQMCNSLTHPYHKVVIHLIGKKYIYCLFSIVQMKTTKGIQQPIEYQETP